MTLNVQHGRGLDRKVNLERIALMVEREKIDIVGLNEVDCCFSRRSFFEDQGEWLASRLKMNYVFGPAIQTGRKRNRQYGNAFLSRYPILSNHNLIFRFKVPVAEPRSLLEAKVATDERNIKVFVSHFSIHPVLNDRMVRFLWESDHSEPTIIMGDFNRKPSSNAYRMMSEKLIDCAALNPHFTFPAKKPRSRLDYIFVTDHFKVIESAVIESDVSDHLPVVALLELD
ncbi:hypothetical protein BKP35_07420 [Anaerobacillus arseniciselenatis]|uniref:Endonuclease/exonuclease/phosphatase domain-containing protein n=1 Tax=Anaerobacillus arseniciselenatis TaxID=85682 RepID=A0A1S2LNX3_9BACI|nr:endonuclease/exonuclease/phosphatase family protein [Anaerobacillus arseniciselenatis]OIJ14181.1 hypothetical protein BKP35_07420 [Anaerobacillus arseniciselenatis]